MARSKILLKEIIEIENVVYPLNIHYEFRKNSYVSIRQSGINIRIPVFLSKKDKERALREMRDWAIQKISKNKDKFGRKPKKEYKDGDIIQVGDLEYAIHISLKNKKTSSAKLINNKIYLSLSSNIPDLEKNIHISTLLSRLVGKHRLEDLEERIVQLNRKFFNCRLGRIVFKNNKSNWGSCSKAGNINISTRLLFAPEDVLEYVCIHELAHLIELNHSSRFWALVEKAMPDYKIKERWLRENGDSCYF